MQKQKFTFKNIWSHEVIITPHCSYRSENLMIGWGFQGLKKECINLTTKPKSKIHPHKFRRTMDTNAIDKGMSIEQVQRLLGHVQIDTTMQYAMVNQNNVKMSHGKFIR